MNLAISNIAWTREEEAQAAKIMSDLGVRYVEVAPTKAWDKPLEASDADIASYRDWWEKQGIKITALQSLNFGRADFAIFGDKTKRAEMLEYLKGITILGTKLGAEVMVFGSPKNRIVGEMPHDDAMAIAIDFFGELGRTAAEHGAIFCIEPNPKDYGCDFVTDSRSGIELVKAVNQSGFGLHLDAAGLTLAGDNPIEVIPEAMPYLKHFHLSAPFLGEVGAGQVDHTTIATTLKSLGYNRKVSIEMKPDGENGENLARTNRAIKYIHETYLLNSGE